MEKGDYKKVDVWTPTQKGGGPHMYLKPHERLDDLEIKNYHIIQNPEMFCYGIDAVLLASFAKLKKNETALDMCTGNGVVAMLLEAKNKCKYIIGIDILEKNIDMANRSIQMNGQTDKISFICGDIKDILPLNKGELEGVNLFLNSEILDAKHLASWHPPFDIITCNPPYMSPNQGLKNENQEKLIARHEIACTLEDIIKTASSLLKYGGRTYMVHRPHRLAEIIYIMKKYKLEPKRLRNVYPYVDKKPTMILIEARKNGGTELTIEPPLVIYNKEGTYTDEILKIYGKL